MIFLGKAVPKAIKMRARKLLKKYPDAFKADFEHNKKFINSLGLPFSKTEGNLISGFIARLISQIKEA